MYHESFLQHLDRVDEAENDEMEFEGDKENSEGELEMQSGSDHSDDDGDDDDNDDNGSSEKEDIEDNEELEFEDDVEEMEPNTERKQSRLLIFTFQCTFSEIFPPLSALRGHQNVKGLCTRMS